MESVEAEGHSIDDAIERALQRLGVSRDKVDIEIVSNSTRGLFGLGGRRAKVRATLRRPLAVAPAGASPGRPDHHPRVESPPRPPEPRASARDGDRSEREGAPPARPRPPAPRQPAANPSERPARPPRRPPEPPPTEIDPASLDRARSVLAEIVRLAGSPAAVEVARDTEGVRLVITGDPSGILIGRRGQTLDALEYVLNRVVAHEDEANGRAMVDVEGYRSRRRQGLEELARRVAERARRRGKPVTLNPMSPRDRRIVHLALQDDPTLTTRSAGTGFYRKVVIVPAGARRSGRAHPTEGSE